MGLLNEKRYGKIRIFEIAFDSLSVSFERQKEIRVEMV